MHFHIVCSVKTLVEETEIFYMCSISESWLVSSTKLCFAVEVASVVVKKNRINKLIKKKKKKTGSVIGINPDYLEVILEKRTWFKLKTPLRVIFYIEFITA